ncbi:hypothetical protein NPS70_18555 [Streptomyces sp. C10-9-1]|uniref:hypothetical protein n=1 Tax=Streptomyces sp. C10-9-1 TaxID=1859285 RepID=UPI00211116F2|nr:hypothetical protein [Streptomyces sp. C10-9-1]MCQ6555175.1 hypothetical protein [Streptomyces sp. C10-9-1]
MKTVAIRRAGAAAVALAAVVGIAGCTGGDDKAAEAPAKAPAKAKLQSREAATEALTTAFSKTSEAKSARVYMTMTLPGPAAVGSMEMDGVLGWNPGAMDLTVTRESFEENPSAPGEARMIMQDGVMYLDMGADAAAGMDGKRWMKLDMAALAEQSGDKDLQKQLTGGLDNLNQDPAAQLAILLDSPNLKHVGSEKIGDVDTEHYEGSLTVAEMLEANSSLDVLTPEQREELLGSVEQSGIENYDIEVWVDGDGYPARMNMGMDTPEGVIAMTAEYSDYGAEIAVETPPADQTVDLAEMLAELGAAMEESTGGAGV